jgi:uncharacterized membrane protein
MKKIIENIKRNAIAGVLFLLPVYILMILIQKAFAFFSKFGNGVAKFFGIDSVFGKHIADIFGFLFLVLLVYSCGYLVRFSFFKQLSDGIDSKLKTFIPGYERHKITAQKKLMREKEIKTGNLQPTPILLQLGSYWQPGHLIEKNEQGHAVVFIPNSVDIEMGSIFVVPFEQIKLLQNSNFETLNKCILDKGTGLLNYI